MALFEIFRKIHSRKNSAGKPGESFGKMELQIGRMFHERSRLLNWKLPTSVLGFIFKQRIVADDYTSTHRLFGGEKEKEWHGES